MNRRRNPRLHRFTSVLSLVLVGILAGLVVIDRAGAAVDRIVDGRLAIDVDGHELQLAYRTTHQFEQGDESITHAYVMVHGTLRNAVPYHDTAVSAARKAGAADHTVVIAPQFLRARDLDAHEPAGPLLYWTNSGWKEGGRSLRRGAHPRPARLSSFAAMDALLEQLPDAFPNLQKLTVAGHSAGGQFVNRYAAAARAHDGIERAGVEITYIVSNPSSYMYFCDERLVDGTTDTFAPVDFTDNEPCESYNQYKYGLEGLNMYMRAVGWETLRSQFASRRVVLLLGAEDNDPESRYLDTRCQAMLQGPHRLARGETYYRYLGHRFGEAVYERHRKAIVPSVGHNSRRMFTSETGLEVVFDGGAPDRAADRASGVQSQ